MKPNQTSFKKGSVPWIKGKEHSIETKQLLAKYNLGKKQSQETIEKRIAQMTGELHPSWKGEDAGYISKHHWLLRTYGNPTKCEECNELGRKINGKWNIEYANISKKYKRNKKDYKELCHKCHAHYDGNIPFLHKLRISSKG